MKTKNSRKKRIVSLALSAAIILSTTGALSGAAAEEKKNDAEAYWSSFGKDASNTTVVDAKLPIDLKNTEIVLDGQKEKLGVCDPIIVGDRMYTVLRVDTGGWYPSADALAYYDVNNFEAGPVKEAKLVKSAGFFSRICYGDGKIFVLLSDRIQAFDAETLEPLWMSEPVSGYQMLSTITYHEGYLYTGYTSGGNGGTEATNGAFVCFSAEDEKPAEPDEIKAPTWTSRSGGYYWAGGVVVKDKIYFAGDAGVLYAHHLTEDIVYDQLDVGYQVRANLLYDRTTNRLVVATKAAGNLKTVELNEDGTFNRQTVRQAPADACGGVTGGPAAYNGRIYVPSGGVHTSGAMAVLDAKTLEQIYCIEGLKSQSVPLITTAYANKANNHLVYLYAVDYMSGILYIFADSEGQTEPNVVARVTDKTLIGGEEFRFTNANSSSFKADRYGNLYFIGGSSSYFGTADGQGYEPGKTAYALTVFRSKDAAFTAKDVENAIDILPAADALEYFDKPQLIAVQSRFDELSSAEQAKVTNRDQLAALTKKTDALTARQIAEAEAAIASIPEPITLSGENAVLKAVELYHQLFETDRAQVKNREKLDGAQKTLNALKRSVAGLIERIEALPEAEAVTLENAAAINEAWSIYEGLSESDRKEVANADKLLAAKDKLKELSDRLLADEIAAEIETLPKGGAITLAAEETITAVYQKYEALHKNVQPLIVNREQLLLAYETVSGYRAAVNEIDEMIWNQLDPLHITLKDQAVIDEIEKKYAALRDAEKEYLKNYTDVKDAKEIIASLKRGIIPEQVFENIRDMDTDYIYEGENYRVAFYGKDIAQILPFRVGITFSAGQEKEIRAIAKDAFVFSTEQTGVFPGKAAVTLKTNLADGTYALYAYENGKAVFQQTVEVKNQAGKQGSEAGDAVVALTRGGEYFLTAQTELESVKTGAADAAAAAAVLLMISICCAGALVFGKKRMKK